MRLSLQIAVVIVATYVVGTLVAFWSLPALPAPKAPPLNSAKLRATSVELDTIFRNPLPTLRKCGLTVSEGIAAASHSELVRAARCLERKHLITPEERRAVERDKDLRLAGSSGGGFTGNAVEYGWAWQETIVWLVGAALIIVLIYRHRQRSRQASV
jgi:hypothetical protein